MGNEGASAYQAMKRQLPKGASIITEKTVVIPWVVIDMNYCKNIQISNYFQTKLPNSNKIVYIERPLHEVIYDCLFKYVSKNVIDINVNSKNGSNRIGFVIAECDDFQIWQENIIYQCNAFAFVGERCDITWEPFGPYPNKKHFFMRVCDKEMAKNMFGSVKEDGEQNEDSGDDDNNQIKRSDNNLSKQKKNTKRKT